MPGATTPNVLIHPDFLRLEEELVTRIGALRRAAGGAMAPVLVLAPSQRQVRRLRRVLAGRCGPLLGVEVLHHQALAYLLVRNDPTGPAPAVASRAILNHLVAEILDGRSDLEPGRHLAEHPGSLAAIAGLVRELRETGIEPVEIAAAAAAPRARDMAALLGLYEEAIGALERLTGLTDRAGLVRRAGAAAAAHPPYRAVFQYGAYELVGMNLELVRSLPAEELVFLVPADAHAPSWSYARDFIARHLGAGPEALDDGDGARPFVGAARRLGTRDGDAGPGSAPDIRLVHAQGPEAELNHAARRVLALLAAGTPVSDIAVVARTLDPYAPLAETVFARHGIPVDTSAALPLSRHPQANAFLLLLRALARNFERQTMVDLLRSPYLARPEDGAAGAGAWHPDRWDRWSRRYRIVEDAKAWIEEIPAALRREEPPEWESEDEESARRFEARRADDLASAQTLAACVSSWDEARASWRRCRSAAEHAAFLRGLARRWIRDWKGAPEPAAARAAEILAGILDDLEGLDEVEAAVSAASAGPARGSGASPSASAGPGRRSAGAGLAVDDVFEFVQDAVKDATVDWSQPGGLAFLDMMQTRGLTFDHLLLVGFNADLLPRRPRENLFLSDALRRDLRERTGRPITVHRESRKEEWLLFAQTMAAARRTLTVTWQRADAEGKTRSVSLFMRELARVLPAEAGDGDAPRADDAADAPRRGPGRVPTHPGLSAAYLARETGLLTREEAALLAAESSADRADAVDGFLGAFDPGTAERMRPGLELARTIDAFAADGAEALRFDGRLPGGTGWDRPFSASSLDTLGTCPLRFYFRYVLGLHPLEEAGEGFRFETRELGAVVHGLLERVYGDLHEAGRLRGGDDPEELVVAGRDALDERWNAAVDPMRRRVEPRFPVLFELAEASWRGEIERFLEADLRRLAADGHRLEGTEESWLEGLDLARGRALLESVEAVRQGLGPAAEGAERIEVRGIPDRVTRDGRGRTLVSDYKTAGKLEKRVSMSEAMKGHYLQLPLYVMLAEARGAAGADAELLGVGPELASETGPPEPLALDGDALATHRASVEETLFLLARLAREGHFPLNPGYHCRWCDYRSPCRRNHYPTRMRVTECAAYRPYFMNGRKSTRTPTLADVPPETGSGEDES